MAVNGDSTNYESYQVIKLGKFKASHRNTLTPYTIPQTLR
jgi:hypothetical protein